MSKNTKLFVLLAVLVVVIAALALFSVAGYSQVVALLDSGAEIAGHLCTSTCSG